MEFELLKHALNAEFAQVWENAKADSDGQTYKLIDTMDEYIRSR